MTLHTATALLLTTSLSVPAPLDWPMRGGEPGRSGVALEVGPDAPTVLWSGTAASDIAFQIFADDEHAFIVRRASTNPADPGDSPVVAHDLDTGAVAWSVDVPYAAGQGMTWVGGVSQGRIYACRSFALSSAPVVAFDAETGAPLWTSEDLCDMPGGESGFAFAPNGDLLVGNFTEVLRVSHLDGRTLWRAPRVGPGNNGVTATDTTVYAHHVTVIADTALRAIDLETGAWKYDGPAFSPSAALPPAVGPDGTVMRYDLQGAKAFEDTGTDLQLKWQTPGAFTVRPVYAFAADGSPYIVGPGFTSLQRLDPATGAVLDSTPLPASTHVRMAADGLGRLYVLAANEASNGTLSSYDADLTPRWSLPLTNDQAYGGPALARNGTLLVPGTGTELLALRNPLSQDVLMVSASAGGVQNLAVHAAGSPGLGYWILGSASGTVPGLNLGPVTLPLNPDPWFDTTLVAANGPFLVDTLGVLDVGGNASAQLVVPPGILSLMGDLTIHQAFAVFDPLNLTVSSASNAAPLTLVP